MGAFPAVEKLARAADHLGVQSTTVVLRTQDLKQYEVEQLSVDADYLGTMGLQLTEGRDFRDRSETDRKTVIVNESMIQNLKLNKPLGSLLMMDSTPFEIIGVVKDFHARNFFHKIKPTIFRVADDGAVRYLAMRTSSGATERTYGNLKDQWKKLFPEVPFDGGLQEDVWGIYFHRVDRSERFNQVVAGIAILLAAIGLYGLVSVNVSGRHKEFSVRKILGAGLRQIAGVIFSDYFLLIGMASLIGIPLSFAFTNAYLNMLFAYPMPMGYSGIVIAVIMLLAIVAAVISTQLRTVARNSIVEGLK